MQACDDKLTAQGDENKVFIPQNKELPQSFLNLASIAEEAAEGERQIIAFMDRYTRMREL